MPLKDLIQKSKQFEIQTYRKHVDPKELKKTCVPFTGSPQKHSFVREKIMLLIEPYDSNTTYYEFTTKDIIHVEELPNITDIDGETVTMVRIWIKKGSIGIRSIPFVIDDIKNQ